MTKKKGFGQGSGSSIVDSMVAARPIGNLPTALKIEILKALKGKNPIKKMKDGGSVKTPKVLPKRKPKATATSTNRKTGATRGAGDDKEYMRKAAAANMKDGGSLNDAIQRVKKAQGMQKGGKVKKRFKKFLTQETGLSVSDADKNEIKNILQETGNVKKKKQPTDRQLMGMEEGGEVPGKRTMEITPEMMEAGRALKKSGKTLRPNRPKNRAPTLEQIKRMRNIEFIRDGIRMKPVTKKMEDGGEVPKKYKGFSKLPERVQQKIDPDLAGKYEKGGVVRGMGRAYAGGSRPVKIR